MQGKLSKHVTYYININEGTEKQVFPCNPYALLCDIKT